MRKIKQIDVTQALELAKTGEKVFVLIGTDKPTIKRFDRLSVGEAFQNNKEFIFFTIEDEK